MDEAGSSFGGLDATIVVINLHSEPPGLKLEESHGDRSEDVSGTNVLIHDDTKHLSVAHAVVDAWDLGPDQWVALALTQGCSIRVHKELLVRESIYFRSLFSNFRESESVAIAVNWDVATFITFLQFLHGGKLDVFPGNVVNLLEGAAFFSIDKVLGKVDSWASKSMLTEEPIDGDVLRSTPLLWSSAKEVGASALMEICVESFSIHFVAGMCLEGFENLPSAFLNACLGHPQLTVHSERQLCEALIRWCTGQAEWKDWFNSRAPGAQNHQFECLKKIRVFLLPLDYLYGCIISKFPASLFRLGEYDEPRNWDSAFDALHDTISSFPRSEDNNAQYTIRLTQYSETLDLSGCQQVTCPILVASAACAPANHRRAVPWARNNFGNAVHPSRSWESSIMSSASPTMDHNQWARYPSFERLCRVCLSNCWRLSERDLSSWLQASCPALRELIVTNCPQLRLTLLSELPESCPFIRVADFSVDTSRLERQMLHVEKKRVLDDGTSHSCPWNHCWLARLSEFSLQGRKDVTDSLLAAVAWSCPSLLKVNLSGCTTLSDSGISRFLRVYTRLLGFQGAWTNFGAVSVTSLIKVFEHGETLDLGGCLGLQENCLGELLRTAASLKVLTLSNTNLGDSALKEFVGEGLEFLDISETQVSGPALAYVIANNTGLKSINTKGCVRIEIATETNAIPPTFFRALGYSSMCLLELKAGWGFSDYVLSLKMPAFAHVTSLDIGLGACSTVNLLSTLPCLQQLSLSFQTVSDESMSKLVEHAPNLQVLELRNCMGSLSSAGIRSLALKPGVNLTSLKLERVASSLTDDDLLVLGTSCKGLRYLSLTGCKALTAKGLEIIADKWPGLRDLKLEECGGTTSDGASHILRSCRALQGLNLRHNGRGLPDTFVVDVVSHLRLLRFLALDDCDATNQGFRLPEGVPFRPLCFYLSKCKARSNPFQIQCHPRAASVCHSQTVISEWNSRFRLSSVVPERLCYEALAPGNL